MLKKIIIAGIFCLSAFEARAQLITERIFEEDLPITWQSIIVVSGGPSWAEVGHDQNLYPGINPPYITTYNYDSPNNVIATGGVLFALQRLVCPTIVGQLGLEIAGATDSTANGVATVDTIPDVYDFSYKLNHGRITLKGKLISNRFHPRLQPYLSGGFGPAFNGSHAYVANSNLPVTYPAPQFASNSTWAFSYNLGLGIQGMITPHWQLGLGYEFADWGKSFLSGDVTNGSFYSFAEGLALAHSYTNSLLFSVGYVF